jgi:hypothetical protein
MYMSISIVKKPKISGGVCSPCTQPGRAMHGERELWERVKRSAKVMGAMHE